MTVLLIALVLLLALDLAALVREMRTDGYRRRTPPTSRPRESGPPSHPYALG